LTEQLPAAPACRFNRRIDRPDLPASSAVRPPGCPMSFACPTWKKSFRWTAC